MKTKTLILPLLATFFPLLLVHQLAAAALKLKNGDQLSVELIADQGEALRVRSPILGELSIPKGQVANLGAFLGGGASSASVVATTGTESSRAPAEGLPEPELVADGELSESGPGLWEYLRDQIPFREWDKRLQLGVTSLSGRKNKKDSNWRFTMSHKNEKDRFNFDAKGYYGEADGETTSDKLEGKFRWRRDLSPGFFYQSETVYLSDEIKRIDLNVEQKLGLGLRFLDSERLKISTGAGASARWREFSSEKLDESDYLVDVFQDWDYRFNDRLRFKQDFRVAMPVQEANDYEYKFSTSLVSDVTKAINLSLRYELGYDNSLDPADRSDRRFVSTMGYTF